MPSDPFVLVGGFLRKLTDHQQPISLVFLQIISITRIRGVYVAEVSDSDVSILVAVAPKWDNWIASNQLHSGQIILVSKLSPNPGEDGIPVLVDFDVVHPRCNTIGEYCRNFTKTMYSLLESVTNPAAAESAPGTLPGQPRTPAASSRWKRNIQAEESPFLTAVPSPIRAPPRVQEAPLQRLVFSDERLATPGPRFHPDELENVKSPDPVVFPNALSSLLVDLKQEKDTNNNKIRDLAVRNQSLEHLTDILEQLSHVVTVCKQVQFARGCETYLTWHSTFVGGVHDTRAGPHLKSASENVLPSKAKLRSISVNFTSTPKKNIGGAVGGSQSTSPMQPSSSPKVLLSIPMSSTGFLTEDVISQRNMIRCVAEEWFVEFLRSGFLRYEKQPMPIFLEKTRWNSHMDMTHELVAWLRHSVCGEAEDVIRMLLANQDASAHS
eukprot:ANDGO_01789.mRNA.1 hypothetical protein